MEKRMSKNELLKLIDSLGIDKEEFYVVSSGALVIRGILEDAGDLDISVSDKGLEQLKQKFKLVPKEDEDWYTINDKAECVCNGPKEGWEFKPQLVENVYVQNIHQYYDYLKTSEREKDKKRIPLVEDYMQKIKKKIL